MATSPNGTRDVHFVGAGLSCALGLPNTAALLEGVLELADDHDSWGVTQDLPNRLREAFEFFYPDGRHEDYRPDVVDFFSTLATYVDISEGLPGTGLRRARDLYEQLQFAICHLLIERTRAADDHLRAGHAFLDEMVRPGNIVVTSNWDFVLERYAQLHNIPMRHAGKNDAEFVLLKLHGSIDWMTLDDRPRHKNNRSKYPDSDYCTLDERLFGERPYQRSLPDRSRPDASPAPLVRIRAFENVSTAWRQIKSRADRPYMVTMGTGKGSRLGRLDGVWEDAYDAISRARRLQIIGYSMPTDDIEIRTLLRTGVQRGYTSGPDVVVRNPSPDVHARIRTLLDRSVASDYKPVDSGY